MSNNQFYKYKVYSKIKETFLIRNNISKFKYRLQQEKQQALRWRLKNNFKTSYSTNFVMKWTFLKKFNIFLGKMNSKNNFFKLLQLCSFLKENTNPLFLKPHKNELSKKVNSIKTSNRSSIIKVTYL